MAAGWSLYRLDGILAWLMTDIPHNTVQDRLLDAAERVVARAGVRNLTLEAVAHEASVSKGGLLYHFPSKSALITAIVDRLANQCEADQENALAGDVAPGAFARAYLTTRAEPLAPEEEPVHTAILAAAGTDPHYLEPFRKRLAVWQARLESDGIDPAIAMVVRLAIDGFCLCRLLDLPVPEGELRRKMLDKLLSMVSPDSVGVRTEEPGPSDDGLGES
jgi:AcrR family transcriptional regulator